MFVSHLPEKVYGNTFHITILKNLPSQYSKCYASLTARDVSRVAVNRYKLPIVLLAAAAVRLYRSIYLIWPIHDAQGTFTWVFWGFSHDTTPVSAYLSSRQITH